MDNHLLAPFYLIFVLVFEGDNCLTGINKNKPSISSMYIIKITGLQRH